MAVTRKQFVNAAADTQNSYWVADTAAEAVTGAAEGDVKYAKDNDTLYVYDGATWDAVGGASDHGTLTGLGDDDHTQYVLASAVGFYGNGLDGALTLDGANQYRGMVLASNVYTMYADLHATNLTISAGVTLKPNGYRIYCTGTLTLNGSAIIHNDGGAASTSTVGAASQGDTNGGGRQGASFVLGQAGAAVPAASNPGTAASALSQIFFGGAGGSGGPAPEADATVNYPGGGSVLGAQTTIGGGLKNSHDQRWLWNPQTLIGGAVSLLNTSAGGILLVPIGGGGGGGSGGRSSTGNAGAGGGGGGVVWISAASVVLSSTCRISANGGAGGDATSGVAKNNGGGGGGGGGNVIIIYGSLTNAGGTVSATGGNGGASVNNTTVQTPMRTIIATGMSAVDAAGTRYHFSGEASQTWISRDRLFLAAVHSSQSAGTPPAPTLYGYGLTWTQVDTKTFDSIATPTHRLTVFKAYGTPDVTLWHEGVVADFAGNVQQNCGVLIDALETSSSTIVASATASTDSATALPVTITPGANNGTWYVAARRGGSAHVAGANMTALGSNASNPILFSEGKQGGETNPTSTWTTNAACAAVAVEVTTAAKNGSPGSDGNVIYLRL